MSAFKLYLDEDSQAHDLAIALRNIGIDVLRSGDAGMDGRSDVEQFAFAASEGRLLMTRNVGDFRVLHSQYLREGRMHAGLVLGAAERSLGQTIRNMTRLWRNRTAEQMARNEEFLSQWGEDRT